MSKSPKPQHGFVSRNLVTIVMVPSIIALHYGWDYMQNNRALVQEHEQIDLPVVTFAKFCWRKLSGTQSSATPTVAAVKSD